MQTAMKIERSVVIKAKQERVWKALTTPEQMVQWFERIEFERLEAGQKIKFSWEPNDSVDFNETYGEITLVVPISRFGYSWQVAPPDPTSTFVIFDLETIAEGTRVTVTETGFEALSDSQREKRYQDNVGGWEYVTNSLAAFVEGQG